MVAVVVFQLNVSGGDDAMKLLSIKRFTHDTGGFTIVTTILTVPETVAPFAGDVIATSGVGVGVAVDVDVGVNVEVAVAVALSVGVAVSIGVAVTVEVAVEVGVAV